MMVVLPQAQSATAGITERLHSLIKPIIIYGSEVWGGFGIKRSASANTEALLVQCLKSDKTDNEKLNNNWQNLRCECPLGAPILVAVASWVDTHSQFILSHLSSNTIQG